MSTHIVFSDAHAHYQHNNNRAEWLGELIRDVKPDTVVALGDQADMPSLSGYDKGKKSFQGRTYRADIDAHSDFQDRLWNTVKRSKRKLPRRFAFIGNHEQRISRAIEMQPELEGTISLSDLNLEEYYNEVIQYFGSTPGSRIIDGVQYLHYAVSGELGRPISGEQPAYTVLAKQFHSTTVGHSHRFDVSQRTRADGKKILGLVAGCYCDYTPDWAGNSARNWWSGCIIKRDVHDGQYSLQMVSLDELKNAYGR